VRYGKAKRDERASDAKSHGKFTVLFNLLWSEKLPKPHNVAARNVWSQGKGIDTST